MAKRPQVSEELVEYVQEMHEDVTGSRATSFQQALQTFHRLHHAADHLELSGDGHGGVGSVERHPSGRPPTHVDPNEQAVFKTRLDADGRLSIPDAERSAFGFEPGQLLQVIAYPVSTVASGGDS